MRARWATPTLVGVSCHLFVIFIVDNKKLNHDDIYM
jgi:hypothetical protein